jgi:hypothetical protein
MVVSSNLELVVFIRDLEPRSRLKTLTTQLIYKFWKRLLPMLHQLQINT